MGDAVNGATSWAFGLFTNRVVDAVLGTKTSRASMETDPVSRVEAKRRRSPVMEIDDESPQTKRVRRSSPPGVTGRMQTEPPSNHRRAGSVKALGFNDVHGPGRPRNLLSSMRSEASMASGKSALSHVPRALSSGLSIYMDRLKMQTPTSPTPGADLQSLTRRTAGVSSAAYNVNRAFSPVESTTFRPSVGPGQGDRMSAQPQVTPTGASFGPTRPALARSALSVTREESPPKRPSLDRHADKAPWAGRSGSVRATSRLGDNSLSRLRTTSLISAASNSSYAPSNGPASAHAPRSNGRTTPTLRDGHISSPPLTSPEPSVLGSPPHSARSSLPPHAQRALEMRNSSSTTLNHSRSFSSPYFGKLRVPVPSSTGKTSSITSTSISGQKSDSHSRSQGATSVTSAVSSKTDTSSKADSKAAAAPYTIGGSKSQGKKILEKRKAEERELDAINLNSREEMLDLHVEPIKTGKENADPALANGIKANGPDVRSNVAPSTVSPQSQRILVPPSSVSESNSGTSSKTVKNKPAHTLEKRTRIPEKDVLSRFNPATNERLIKARNAGSGRYSMPPDDDEDTPGVEEMKRIQKKTVPLVLPKDFKIEKFGAGSDAPSGGKGAPSAESTGSDAMNITPVKEKYDQEDSPADMMSTTPTESSIKNSFKITSIVKPAQPPTSNLFAAAPSSGGTFGGATPRMDDAISSQESTAFPQAVPAGPDISMSPPEDPPTKVSTASSTFGATAGQANSGLGNLSGPAIPAPLPFSFGAPSVTPAPSTFSFGSAPTSAPSASSSLLGGPQANDKKSPPPPTVIVTEPPKPISSFFATPPVTSNSEAAKSSLFGAPAQPSQSAPKPLFSFPTTGTSGATPTEPKKDVLPPFSFGAPPASTMGDTVTTPIKQPAPFSFANASTTPATPTTISAGTPSPQKPGFSTTPAPLPPLSTTTPLGTPFTFEGTPSPVRPVPSVNDESPTKTPTKAIFSFGVPSTTPLITPATASNTFSFGNKASSTTPAETPSAPFSFNAGSSASTSASAPFSFGTTNSVATTTPAAAPPSGGFNFSFGANTDLKNPFQATTPSPTKPFSFGAGAPPAAPSVPSFSFGQSGGDTTPTAKPVTGFNFGQSQSSNATPTPTPTTTTGFSFGGPASSSASAPTTNGIHFPSGPRTPLTKVRELDGMDTSPIRGGNTPGGPTFSGTSGSGFSFATNNSNNNASGGFGSAPTSATPFGSGNTGFGAPSSSTFGAGGGFARDSSPAPTPSPFGFGGNGTASGAFGHSATSAPPSAGGFGGASGFSLTPISPEVASPFNPPQSFGSPAASPFTQPATLGGANPFAAPGQRASVGSALEFTSGGSDAGSTAGGEGRKIMPMPKSRRARTAAENRSLLQRAHGH